MEKIPTHFAPAERASDDTVRKQYCSILDAPTLKELSNSIPDLLMVINQHRQLVYGNSRLLSLLELPGAEEALGNRPGELFDCIHSKTMPGGCGTSKDCRHCGLVLAVLASQNDGERVVSECRVAKKNDQDGLEFLDFQVWVSPVSINGDSYSIVAVSDIGQKKRLGAMDKIFYHDLLNAAGGLLGVAGVLKDGEYEESSLLVDDVHELANRLVQVIETQRDVIAAEKNKLTVTPTPFSVRDLIYSVVKSYQRHPVGINKVIRVSIGDESLTMISDSNLLSRALGNLLKNALEACQQNQAVSIGVTELGDQLEFRIQNPGAMPKEVRENIFNCAYSTKGSGRGLGTYSVKLLSERYLNGLVRFESNEEDGTTFFLTLPRIYSL